LKNRFKQSKNNNSNIDSKIIEEITRLEDENNIPANPYMNFQGNPAQNSPYNGINYPSNNKRRHKREISSSSSSSTDSIEQKEDLLRKKKYYQKRLEGKLKAKKEDKLILQRKEKENEELKLKDILKQVQFKEAEKRLYDDGSQYNDVLSSKYVKQL